MWKYYTGLLAAIVFYAGVSRSSATYWNKFAVPVETCASKNVRLLSMLNLLCNATQTTSIQMRDACYGCFFRAGSTVDGPTQLSSLNDCAKLYIAESAYSTCAANLQAIVDGNRPPAPPEPLMAGFCYTGYCDFVRCVQRINAHQLVSMCYAESLGTRQTIQSDQERIYFYTNITSCILAKTRCSQYHPITGELQNQFVPGPILATKVTGWIGGKVLPPPHPVPPLFHNSLQISESGEIRVITFPAGTAAISDVFCARHPTLQQAGFDTYNC